MESPLCLAYVFWHWVRADGEVEAYEQALGDFQRALRDNPSPGFRQGAVFRHGTAPWLPAAGAHYVDWYVIDGSAALDPLNDAAVSAACLAAHDAAAARAAGGTAGLYGLVGGLGGGLGGGLWAARDVRAATWFSKPGGISYAALEAAVAEHLGGADAMLWSRRMTLGPAPEMCLLGSEPFSLPPAFNAVTVAMELLWPGDGDDASARDTEVPLH